MNYKIYIYAIMLFVSMFALSGINYTGIFKKDHIIEAKIMIILLALSLAYLSGCFIISCIGL